MADKESIDQILESLKSKFPTLAADVPGFTEVKTSVLETLQLSSKKSFTFLLVGRTGVGKSSTINSLMGQEVALVNDFEPETCTVEPYTTKINGIEFTVIDTPGLCDSSLKEKDREYLKLMKSKAKTVDLMWFVTPLDESRVRSDELSGLQLISEAFGSEIWNHSIIVFTCADKVDATKFSETLQTRTQLLQREIQKLTDANADSIPSVAVTNRQETTPDGKKWLGELYVQALSRITSRGALPFFLATANRVGSTHFGENTSSHSEKRKTKTGTAREEEREATDRKGKDSKNATGQKIGLDDDQKERVRKVIDARIIPGLATLGRNRSGV